MHILYLQNSCIFRTRIFVCWNLISRSIPKRILFVLSTFVPHFRFWFILQYYTLPLTFPLFLLHSGAGKAGSEKGAGAGTAGGGPGPSGQKAETVILSKNALDNGEVLHFFLEFLQLASL